MAIVKGKDFFGGSPGTVVQQAGQPAFSPVAPPAPKTESPKSAVPFQETPAGKFGINVAEDLTKRKQNITDAVKRSVAGQQNPLSAGEDVFNEVAKGTANIAAEGVKAVLPPSVKDFIKKGVSSFLNESDVAGTGVTAGEALKKIEETFSHFSKAYPEASKALETAFNGLTLGVGGEGAPKVASTLLDEGVNASKGLIQEGKNLVNEGVSAADSIVQQSRDLASKVKTTLAERNVDPRVKQSAQRLEQTVERQGIGETKVKDPVTTYDEFVNQEKKFKGDIKQDTALGVVGSKIGNAYDTVAQQRRDVGKVMGDELKKVGHLPTDISPSFGKLEQELKDNGLTYDAKKNILSLDRTAKVTGQDKQMLQTYIRELNKLGDSPTVAELDAFLSRIPKEIDVFKNTNNVTQVTNGERIVKQHLRELRNELTSGKNPSLTRYAEARGAYSDLSDFLDEGSSFLGKKTQTGDYAKDASLAKSSVQSILNNGKKDWLLKLEQLSGYPALDESVLALQAMKDTGNFRGQSLLELLNDGSIPTSKAGVTQKIIDFGLKKAADAFTGTPEEQTRQYLKSLQSGKNTLETTPKINQTTAKTTAKGQQSTNKTSQSNKPISNKDNTRKTNTQGGFVANPFKAVLRARKPQLDSLASKLDEAISNVSVEKGSRLHRVVNGEELRTILDSYRKMSNKEWENISDDQFKELSEVIRLAGVK